MRFSRTSKALGMVAIAALALTGCGAGGGSNAVAAAPVATPARSSSPTALSPSVPCMPADTNEVGGGKVIDMMFSGLVSYDANGKPVNELAESIEGKDGQHFTIKIKKDQKFTNGEAITAKTFVDSWNFGAAAKNAQLSGNFFESIKGYDEASAEGSTVDTMSGLKVVDDQTFTVELTQPESDWPLRLGYTAFVPVPSGALADPKALRREARSATARTSSADGGWQHNVQIQLVPNPDYNGPRKAKNAGVTFKIYQNDDAAYQDLLSNNLDVLQTIPTSALKNLQVGPRRPHHQQAVRRQPDHRHPGIPAGVERRGRQAAPPGHLHGDQPRRNHQGDLQRRPPARPRTSRLPCLTATATRSPGADES